MTFKKTLAATILAAGMAATAAHTALAADDAATAEARSEYVKPNMTHEAYGKLDIVVPLTTDDKGVQGKKLRNIANSLKAAEVWKGEMKVAVVIYAKGITLLKSPDEKVRKELDALRGKGVRFLVCDNTLSEQGLDFHKLYNVTDADIVPSGFAEVAFLQARKHFVLDSSN